MVVVYKAIIQSIFREPLSLGLLDKHAKVIENDHFLSAIYVGLCLTIIRGLAVQKWVLTDFYF
jgi:hypothetical protein